MRRLVLLSAVLLGVDQLTKSIAQLAFDATDIAVWGACRDAGLDCVDTLADIVVAPGVGLMYTVHPGLYWWPDRPLLIAGLHAVVLGVWVGAMAAAVWYRRRYRSSVAVDLAAAFFTAAAWGNLIDRLLVGGARDWLATQWWIANFADAAGWLVCLCWPSSYGATRRRAGCCDPHTSAALNGPAGQGRLPVVLLPEGVEPRGDRARALWLR